MAVDWTRLRGQELRRFYGHAHVEMQCQSGSGQPLPGKWTDLPIPPIWIPLSPKSRQQACAEHRWQMAPKFKSPFSSKYLCL